MKLKDVQNALPTETWCPQILTGLSIRNDGLLPCCEYEGKAIPADSVEEYKKSKTYKSMLKAMNRGEWHQGCIKCKMREDNGQMSQRTHEVINHFNSLNNKSIDITDIDPKSLNELSTKNEFLWINLQPTNKCNQACIMCHPTCSSKLQEEVDLYDRHWIEDKKVTTHEYKNLVEIASHRHSRGRIYLSGGEPSIMRDTLRYLETIDNPEEIDISLNSNFQVYNEKFWNIIKKFGSVHILASIDGIGKRIEYQRGLSNWNSIEKNLLHTRDFLGPSVDFKINPCWTIFNSFYASEIGDWTTKHNFEVDAMNIAYYPSHLSITSIDDDYKKLLSKEFSHNKFEKYTKDLTVAVKNAKFDKQKFKRLLHTVDLIKSVRGQDYNEYYPIVGEYINKMMEKHNVVL